MKFLFANKIIIHAIFVMPNLHETIESPVAADDGEAEVILYELFICR